MAPSHGANTSSNLVRDTIFAQVATAPGFPKGKRLMAGTAKLYGAPNRLLPIGRKRGSYPHRKCWARHRNASLHNPGGYGATLTRR